MRRPEPLQGAVQPPAQDAGGPGRAGPSDAGPTSSSDALGDGGVWAGVDAGLRDAAASDSGRDAGGTPDMGQGMGRRDAGAADAATIISPLASTVVAQNVGTVDVLAADGATLYALTHDNVLWALDGGSATPRRLAQDAGTSPTCGAIHRLAQDGTDLFWSAQYALTLHRTAKNGATDTVIATGNTFTDFPLVAADETRVYWVEGNGGYDVSSPGAVIRALPVDAAPGTTPTTLVEVPYMDLITGMTVAGPTLYWVHTWLGTTMPQASLDEEAITALLAPQPLAPSSIGASWFVQPHDGDLYVEIISGPSYLPGAHVDLARESQDLTGLVDLAPIGNGNEDNIVFVDDWALVSIPSGACGDYRHSLIAVPTAAPGGPVVHLGDDLGTPAVLGTELAFVDLTGQVHLSTLDQVRAALAPAASQ